MKTNLVITLIICFLVGSNAEAQFLKKLKQRAEQAAERTILNNTDEVVSQKTEKTIDDITEGDGGNSNDNSTDPNASKVKFENPSKEIKTEAKRAFYTHDVIVKSFDKEKQTFTTNYFDADELAMQSNFIDQNTGKPKTTYIDSEGYFIGLSSSKGIYTKSNLLSMGAMGMMAPSMMISAYKLPAGPFWEKSEELNNQGLKLNTFMFIEFAFVYTPDHFRDEMNGSMYSESKLACRGGMGCTKFSVTESGYSGSYILFDAENRLAEINVAATNDPFFGTNKSKIEFLYEPCEVNLPAAVEEKMPMQDLLMKGMSPNINED
ncbi:hypothetical protein KO566_12850 [Flavobacteriaceae bacterium XHP0103]|uniref:hypothetical protein n=1 Tax=Marixanthotalea marina TaxID=2844359 RepID=UPI002989AEAF|nr:hypothetical protein [Marixanthotalea marina]MBU3822952.1 hypothetical protein [Marixanthotalea marina]